MNFYQIFYVGIAVVLIFLPISLVIYMLINLRIKKNNGFKHLEKQDDADKDQVFVEHRGEKIPIYRRELPMWSKMKREDKNALLETFRNATKKGKMKSDGKGGWIKIEKVLD